MSGRVASLAGEGLKLSLMQMQKSFFRNNKRGIEVEKIFSLKKKMDAQWDTSTTAGLLQFSISNDDLAVEGLETNPPISFLIKTVNISIPAVVGPYQTFDAIFKQTSNKTSKDGTPNYGTNNQTIVISRGIEDSGLFVLDFNDERYLPFEGTGAISTWEFTLKKDMSENISDVIFTIKYVIK